MNRDDVPASAIPDAGPAADAPGGATGDPASASDARVAASAWLAHVGGLHARPAIKLTKLARRFAADIMIAAAADGPWKDAKSIAQVLAMKVPVNTTLHFSATGADAGDALRAIVALVDADFEAGGTSGA